MKSNCHLVFFLVLKSNLLFQVIAENLSEEEIIGLKEMFKALDTDKNGIVTLEELRTGLPKLGNKISEAEIKQLMEAVSLLSLWCLLPLPKTKAYYCFFFFGLGWYGWRWINRLLGVYISNNAYEQNRTWGSLIHSFPILWQWQQRVNNTLVNSFRPF